MGNLNFAGENFWLSSEKGSGANLKIVTPKGTVKYVPLFKGNAGAEVVANTYFHYTLGNAKLKLGNTVYRPTVSARYKKSINGTLSKKFSHSGKGITTTVTTGGSSSSGSSGSSSSSSGSSSSGSSSSTTGQRKALTQEATVTFKAGNLQNSTSQAFWDPAFDEAPTLTWSKVSGPVVASAVTLKSYRDYFYLYYPITKSAAEGFNPNDPTPELHGIAKNTVHKIKVTAKGYRTEGKTYYQRTKKTFTKNITIDYVAKGSKFSSGVLTTFTSGKVDMYTDYPTFKVELVSGPTTSESGESILNLISLVHSKTNEVTWMNSNCEYSWGERKYSDADMTKKLTLKCTVEYYERTKVGGTTSSSSSGSSSSSNTNSGSSSSSSTPTTQTVTTYQAETVGDTVLNHLNFGYTFKEQPLVSVNNKCYVTNTSTSGCDIGKYLEGTVEYGNPITVSQAYIVSVDGNIPSETF